jgi:RHS repeat-associated protein
LRKYFHILFLGLFLVLWFEAKSGQVVVSGMQQAAGGMRWSNNFQLSTFNFQFVGSPCVIFVPNGNTKDIVQTNDYYPFGSTFRSTGSSDNRYRREGKEFISDHQWNKYDYHWRAVCSMTGRTLQIDPMAEKYPWISPYALFNNNPLRYIDPDGRDWYSFQEAYTYTNRHGEEKTRTRTMYKYTTEHRSQKDLDKAGIEGKYLGKVHFSQDTYYRLEGGTTSTRNFETTFNAIAEDFGKMSSKDAKANQSKAETYFSSVNWNENLPTSLAAFGNIYAVSTSKNTYVNLTDKSLKREFDYLHKREVYKNSRFIGPYFSPLSDPRPFVGFFGLGVVIINPYPVPNPIYGLISESITSSTLGPMMKSTTISYYNKLLSYYRKYNIIK